MVLRHVIDARTHGLRHERTRFVSETVTSINAIDLALHVSPSRPLGQHIVSAAIGQMHGVGPTFCTALCVNCEAKNKNTTKDVLEHFYLVGHE